MSDRIPYTYFVLHIPTGLKYYGSKYGKGSNPDTFWKSGGYFTSSVKVKNLVKEYGIDSFKAEVRKVFESPDQALNYEYRFLKKVSALDKSEWLNENLGGEKFRNFGPASEKNLSKNERQKDVCRIKPKTIKYTKRQSGHRRNSQKNERGSEKQKYRTGTGQARQN
jgi:hypothetical protein